MECHAGGDGLGYLTIVSWVEQGLHLNERLSHGPLLLRQLGPGLLYLEAARLLGLLRAALDIQPDATTNPTVAHTPVGSERGTGRE